MGGIKKKDLEMKLEDIPSHPDPSPSLEQYTTSSHIAADVLFTAYVNEDIFGKVVADLGCGTGIFALGSAYLGAEKVIGVDIDEKAVETAERVAEDWSLLDVIDFEVKDIDGYRTKVDTVIMNPPFGAQDKGADISFLEKAFEVAERVYSLHNAKTMDFLKKFIKDHGYCVFWEKRYMFDIYHMFEYHTKEKEVFEVAAFGMKAKRE
ncbi:MAG: METTL5 family protein [Candidatus Natronoplasma sp.]